MRDWLHEVRQRTALPRDVAEEVAQHIADLHRAALFKGLSEADADASAERELDNVEAIAEAIRRRKESPQPQAMAGVGRDLRHAWRLITARPGYSSVMVLTLAIGVGACTTVFSLFNSLLLTPLPYPNPDRLVLVWETAADDHTRRFIVSQPNYRDWVNETRSFEQLGLWEGLRFNLSASAEPEQVAGARVSSSLFKVLGVEPAIGRVFSEAEDAPGHKVAVISDAVWKIHFASDPSVLGKPIRLNAENYEVVGVMPAGFRFPGELSRVWIPIGFTKDEQQRRWHSFVVAGRIRPDVTFEQARDEMERLGETMRQRYEENATEGATIERMADVGMLNTKRILIALSVAVGLVLLIACVNVASLQLAFGLARRREFVTRLSLGARYSHLIRQVTVESAVIAMLGCAGGIAIAYLATRGADVLMSSGFRTLPFRGQVAVNIDWRVLLFSIVVSSASALLFAFAPLSGIRRQALQPIMREGDRGTTRFAVTTRRVLVAVEIALAIVVLCSAGLMIRSLTRLLDVEPGLDARNVLVMQVSLPQARPFAAPERPTFCNDLARELAAVPGILKASAISHLPLSGGNADRLLTIEGRPEPPRNDEPNADYRVACPDYFATLGIPLIAGREFTARDVADGEPVAIVNRAFVDDYWPEGDALGKRFKIGGFRSANPWLRVVGISENVRHFGLEVEPSREFYQPYAQAAWPEMTIVSKTAGDSITWQRAVREAIRRVEADLPAANPRSMEDVISRSIEWRQTPMRLLSAFAIVGLLLAGIGIYGVLAYYVSQRRRELGVRVALGATKAAVVALVIRQSALPVAIGIAAGIAGSFASGRLLQGLLYDVEPGDPIVLSAIVCLLLFVSLISSWLPARRAALVDPLVALREE